MRYSIAHTGKGVALIYVLGVIQKKTDFMDEKNRTNIEFSVDMGSLKTVGEITAGESNIKINEINLLIHKSIRNAFIGMTKWIDVALELINENKHQEAFELIRSNKGSLAFNKKQILEEFLKLDIYALSKENRKDYILVLIGLAAGEQKFGRIENVIDCFYSEFSEEVEPSFKQSLILIKANAAAQNDKINVANINYKQVIDNDQSSSIDIAYAYRGLAKISNYYEDKIIYSQKSADKFLENGKKKETVIDLFYIAELLEKEDTDKALNRIDLAINIYDSENSLDKEFLASIYHRKASYLYSLGETERAFESIQKACSLRENLIGNEYEKYSSFSTATAFARMSGNTEKEKYYSQKADEIKPTIDSYEFQLQQEIENEFSEGNEIKGDLLFKIEKTEFYNLQFSTYLHNSIVKDVQFEIRIDWIDKAKLVLGKDKFHNTHYSLLYFTLAEVYRQVELTELAIENYEESLRYNPFNSQAIQNCGATLWSNKLWGKSITFFQKQIEKLGESPNLCYVLGRSFFEDGKMQDAFTYFRKAQKEIKSVHLQEYISKCIEQNDDLRLTTDSISLAKTEDTISLESFKQTLDSFSDAVSSNSRMHFWKYEDKDYKWDSNPEEKGKQLLITAFETKYGKKSIDIIQERRAGAGIIDLYVILKGGLKIVVELKICGGSGYSLNYALSGQDQLIHYIKNTDTRIGFLIVFDGRTRDFGKGFKSIQSVDEITIFNTAIDMRPRIEKGK